MTECKCCDAEKRLSLILAAQALQERIRSLSKFHSPDCVQRLSPERNINSTMLYTQLVNFREDEYHVSVAKNSEEACRLVKSGFQYVTGEYTDGGKIFRKPK